MDVWEAFRQFFEDDDGALPEIDIVNMPREQVIENYAFLKSLGFSTKDCDPPATIEILEPDFHSRPLDDVPNAAELVVDGMAQELYYVSSLRACGVELPGLGLWVLKDGIGLNIRRGPQWTPPCALAYLEILRRIWNTVPSPKFDFREFDSGGDEEKTFIELWPAFLQSPSHSPL